VLGPTTVLERELLGLSFVALFAGRKSLPRYQSREVPEQTENYATNLPGRGEWFGVLSYSAEAGDFGHL
jgi:hypothetical protein